MSDPTPPADEGPTGAQVPPPPAPASPAPPPAATGPTPSRPPPAPSGCLGTLKLAGLLFLGLVGLAAYQQHRARGLAETARDLVRAGDMAGAAERFRQALEDAAATDRPGFGHELAAAELGRGRPDLARAALHTALRLAPDYRPPAELEARLGAGLPELAALRFEVGLGRGSLEGFRRVTAPGPEVPARFTFVSDASPGVGAPSQAARVESFMRAFFAAHPALPDLEVHALARRDPAAPARLAYLGRYAATSRVDPPLLRFTAAPQVGEPSTQTARDALLIRELDLDPLAYHWLYVRLHRGGDPQVRALVERMATVDSKTFFRLLEWDGFLRVEHGGDSSDVTHASPAAFATLPDAVVRAGVRSFEKGFFAGLGDGWARDLGRAFRGAAEARGLEPD